MHMTKSQCAIHDKDATVPVPLRVKVRLTQASVSTHLYSS